MRFLAIETERPGVRPERMKRHLRAEAEAVWRLQQADVIRSISFAEPGRRAVLLLECAGEREAMTILATLPLVRARCIGFELLTLRAYDGYERLFARAPQTKNPRRVARGSTKT
jgi:hypothetical protein